VTGRAGPDLTFLFRSRFDSESPGKTDVPPAPESTRLIEPRLQFSGFWSTVPFRIPADSVPWLPKKRPLHLAWRICETNFYA
jgi:hypothetical protein